MSFQIIPFQLSFFGQASNTNTEKSCNPLWGHEDIFRMEKPLFVVRTSIETPDIDIYQSQHLQVNFKSSSPAKSLSSVYSVRLQWQIRVKNQSKKWRTTKYQIVKYNNIHANVWQFKSSMEWNAGIYQRGKIVIKQAHLDINLHAIED